tara:strand:+ start:2750 stop:2932 length:183 start_codon:yes stop_codon:yes gene_type:complete
MKERAIQIVKNLSITIDKLRKVENRTTKAQSAVFSNPSASVSQLETKRKQIISRYKLKKQ